MTALFDWVRKHQIAAFIVLVFIFLLVIPLIGFFMWTRFFSMNRIVSLYLSRLAIYGPALAGIIITRIASGGHRQGAQSARVVAFIVSWAVVSLVSVVYHLRVESISATMTGTLLLAAPIAVLPAIVISGAFSSIASIRSYLSSLVRPKGNPVWYGVALLTFPVIHMVGTTIVQVHEAKPVASSISVSPDLLLAALLTFARVLFFTGGINEECGWRGFMLPRLQARICPIAAGMIIWGVHMIWELPGDLLSPGASWPWLSRLVLMPCWSVLFLWVYNRTNGSILAPVLFHASMNAMNPLMEVFPVSTPVIVLLAVTAVFSIVWDRMWQRLPEDHPAVYCEVHPNATEET